MTVKDTKGKLKVSLIPPRALISIAKVREFGVSKYKDAWSWVDLVKVEDLQEAIDRHQLKIKLGETLDDESGLPHSWHIACSAAMICELELKGKSYKEIMKIGV
jgi:hypothetical protein